MKRSRFSKLHILFGLAALVWMAVIFSYSSKTAVQSTEDSCRVGMYLGQVLIPDFDDWTFDEQYAFAEKVDHPVRKTAHAMEYALLGVLLSGTFCTSTQKAGGSDQRISKQKRFDLQANRESAKARKGILKTAWLLATLYAATDEFHQLFVEGRSCQPTDVLIDSAGALAGCFLVGHILFLIAKREKYGRCQQS